MKTILFRADAKPSIGVGDLISLISLSKYFIEAGWKAYFMIRGYEAGLKIAARHGLPNVTVLAADCSLEDEIRTINMLCDTEKIDIVFFEITERGLSEYRGLNDTFKKAAISFDGSLLDDLSVVVSWVPDADELFLPGKYPNAKFLLGYEYVTIPPEFYVDERIESRKYKQKAEKLLIAMGGADEYNLTQKVVDVLIKNNVDIAITIVAGGGYEYLANLERSLAGSVLNFEIKHNLANMLDEYLSCDIAVGAGGLTASELVASRTPALLIAAYEHQIGRCEFFQSQRWVKYLGFRDIKGKDFMYYINNLPLPLTAPLFRTSEILYAIEEEV